MTVNTSKPAKVNALNNDCVDSKRSRVFVNGHRVAAVQIPAESPSGARSARGTRDNATPAHGGMHIISPCTDSDVLVSVFVEK